MNIGFGRSTSFALVMLLGCQSIHSQQSARDTVVELSRIDTNRALELQILSPNKTNAVKLAIQKQVNDDFRDLQTLNNKMMGDAWARPELDFKYISEMVGQISKRAARLRSNLGFPKSKEERENKPAQATEISSATEFRKELLTLDRSVMNFVTNPIFRKTSVVHLDLANQASRDLNAVVELSSRLKKVGEKLKQRATGQRATVQRAKG
jgi:hypothetical protein